MKHAVSLLIVVAMAGCSDDARLSISGMVTLDGQPLQNGTIDFLPADGNGPTAGAVVETGQYAIRVVPGKKIVRIRGYKVVGRELAVPGDDTSPMVDVTRQIVPEKYNAKTQLQCDVTEGQENCDFTLDGK